MTNPEPEYPLRAGMRLERVAPPCAIIIFGATGDLTKRKQLPALFRLAQQQLIPAQFAIIGTARQEMSDDDFRDRMKQALTEFSDDETAVDEPSWQRFATGISYVAGEFGDPKTYTDLQAGKHSRGRTPDTGQSHLLSAAAPDFCSIVQRLGASGLKVSRGLLDEDKRRNSGPRLEYTAPQHRTRRGFKENQIYRIDHYLGKGNRTEPAGLCLPTVFGALWNRQYGAIQITNAETSALKVVTAITKSRNRARHDSEPRFRPLRSSDEPPALSANWYPRRKLN